MGTPINYTDIDFVNGGAPALNATNLNHIVDKSKAAADRVDAYGLDATCAAKASVADADELLTRDSADGNYVKKVTWTTVFTAIWTKLGALIAGGTDKATPADADTLALSDSAVSGATKKLTIANLMVKVLSAIGKTNLATGFTLAGGTTPKTLTVSADADSKDIPTAAGKTAADAIGAATGATTALKLANLTSPASTSQQGVALLAADGGTTAGTAVQGNDGRLQSAPASWTPHPYFTGTLDDGTRTTPDCSYTRSGKRVHIEGKIVWTVKGTKTGYLSIRNLPVAGISGSIPCGFALITTGGVSVTSPILLTISSTNLSVFFQSATGVTNVTDTNFSATTEIRFYADYIAA